MCILAAGYSIFQLRIKTALGKFAKLDNKVLVLQAEVLFKLYIGVYIFFQEECAGSGVRLCCLYTKINTTLFFNGADVS